MFIQFCAKNSSEKQASHGYKVKLLCLSHSLITYSHMSQIYDSRLENCLHQSNQPNRSQNFTFFHKNHFNEK